MVDDRILHAPLTYSPTWAVLGAALLLLAGLTLVVVVLVTRPTPLRLPRLARRATRVRTACLRRVDEVVAAHERGTLDAATAASELSLALRRFAAEWSGARYPGMTLADLEAADGDPRLRAAVADLYQGAFDPDADPDVPALAATVREVVARWNRS
jgi:hypothetical protein